jgi:hypothetical protein
MDNVQEHRQIVDEDMVAISWCSFVPLALTPESEGNISTMCTSSVYMSDNLIFLGNCQLLIAELG